MSAKSLMLDSLCGCAIDYPSKSTSIRKYATDPALIPRMLEWLHSHVEEVAIWAKDGDYYAMGAIQSPMHVMLGEAGGDYEAEGMTINEALAWLVITVFESINKPVPD